MLLFLLLLLLLLYLLNEGLKGDGIVD